MIKMLKQILKKNVFFLTVKSPAVSILVILLILASILIITYSSYTNVYTKQSAVINYKNDDKEVFIEVSIDKNALGKVTMNSEVLWYLEQEGDWYNASIVEIKDISDQNLVYLQINPVKEDIQKAFKNKPEGSYPINIEVLTGRKRMIEQIFSSQSAVAK